MGDEKTAAEQEEAVKKEEAVAEIRATVTQALKLGVRLGVLERGVAQAQLNCAEHAALQMAQGLPPLNLWGHLVRLDVLADELAKHKPQHVRGLAGPLGRFAEKT